MYLIGGEDYVMNKTKTTSDKVLAIVGPTASGKTNVSIQLAKVINAEIISCDSRQIYKYIPIATCAPTQAEQGEVKHYFINELKPEEEFNAGLFARLARERITDIRKKGKRVIITGGSGLYLKALIDGFFEADIKDKTIRENLNLRLEKEGKEKLYEELRKVDPESAEKMGADKPRRVLRALEVFYGTGRKISELQKENVKPDFSCLQIGISYKREVLYSRINERVDAMINNGLLDEIRRIQKKGYHPKTHNSLNTVGVKEVFRFFENEIKRDLMVTLIKQNTRQYAKRQMTWFRKDHRIKWLDMEELQGNVGAVSYILNILLDE